MDLKSPSTLVAAWVLVPLAVAALAAGLGLGLRLASGVDLRALTLPAGYLTGIALVGALMELGAPGWACAAVVVVLALAGPAWLLARGRGRGGAALRRARARLLRLPPHPALWAGAAALAAYLIGLAPLAGSGRSGVLGYVLNNDSAVHIMLVQWIAENTADRAADVTSSYTAATSAFAEGYPLGTYAWPVVATELSGVEAFHLWTPLIAVTLAMTALVCVALLRTLDAPPALAAAGGALAAAGYLPLSYLAQGGAKELIMPLAVLGSVALAARALDGGVRWRALLPAVLAAAAAVANLGYSALAWLGPAGLVVLGVLIVRARRGRGLRELRSVAIVAGVGALLALPAAVESIEYFRAARLDLRDPNEVGNLLGPLPLAETLNVWLALDYRFDAPDARALTWLGVALAAAAALLGLAHAARRRNLAVPLAAATALAGAALVYPRVSVYFEAKTLVVVAPALGVLSAAGVLALWRADHPRARPAAAALGCLLAGGVLASAAYVYAGAWNTPRERFEELGTIGERYAGRGPMLVNDREFYADYLLRRSEAWNSWSQRAPFRELRSAENLPFPMPHAPDFDDYQPHHLHRFGLLLERRRPGGSRPPSNFEVDFETPHYRVWRRVGPDPPLHVPMGNEDVDGSAPLRCEAREVREVLRRARAQGARIAVSQLTGAPVRAMQLDAWIAYERARVVPPAELVGRGAGTGFASGTLELAPGRYRAWVQGSYGPGVRLWAGPTPYGEAINDLGLPSQWHDVGTFEATGRTTVALVALERSLLLAGSRHHELSGALWVEPADVTARVEEVEPEGLRRFCGREVDWLELRPS